jgi:uncharacterized protein (TIGR01319 family)
MPTIHELNVHAARAAIHEQFIRQITYAKGLGDLQNTLTDKKVMPTPGAVLLATELLSRGTYREKGIGSLMVLDVGGATTDVHSVMPYLDELKTEERGLVVNNEKQASYRTVEGNLGMRVSATGIVDAAGPLALAKRAGDGCEEMQEKIRQYAGMLEKNPEHLAQDEKERRIDIAMAATALEVAMKRHAGILSQRFDPVLGIIPGYPMGRDLRSVEKVIAVGGIFTYSDDIVRQEILTEAFAAPGISLLPEAPQFAVDDKYFLYAMGVLSQYIPDAVLKLAKKYFAWRRPPG